MNKITTMLLSISLPLSAIAMQENGDVHSLFATTASHEDVEFNKTLAWLAKKIDRPLCVIRDNEKKHTQGVILAPRKTTQDKKQSFYVVYDGIVHEYALHYAPDNKLTSMCTVEKQDLPCITPATDILTLELQGDDLVAFTGLSESEYPSAYHSDKTWHTAKDIRTFVTDFGLLGINTSGNIRNLSIPDDAERSLQMHAVRLDLRLLASLLGRIAFVDDHTNAPKAVAHPQEEQRADQLRDIKIWNISDNGTRTLCSVGQPSALTLWNRRKTVYAAIGLASGAIVSRKETGKEKYIFEGHTHPVVSLAATPDCSQLASASTDNTVRLWDLKNGNPLRILWHTPQSIYLNTVSFGNNKHFRSDSTSDFLVSGNPEEIFVWDMSHNGKTSIGKNIPHDLTHISQVQKVLYKSLSKKRGMDPIPVTKEEFACINSLPKELKDMLKDRCQAVTESQCPIQ